MLWCHSPIDYTQTYESPPESCYAERQDQPFTKGCANQLTDMVQLYLLIITILIIISIPIEICSVICAVLLLNKVKSIPWRMRLAYC
ncbi:unnamed protein product [Heterobilharzia americana]|nr:unnamed protein product [Heterobilharzia americana]